jgi:alanine racemase
MAVVKADGYGHGAVPVSWHLLGQGVTSLGVGDSQEAPGAEQSSFSLEPVWAKP